MRAPHVARERGRVHEFVAAVETGARLVGVRLLVPEVLGARLEHGAAVADEVASFNSLVQVVAVSETID